MRASSSIIFEVDHGYCLSDTSGFDRDDAPHDDKARKEGNQSGLQGHRATKQTKSNQWKRCAHHLDSECEDHERKKRAMIEPLNVSTDSIDLEPRKQEASEDDERERRKHGACERENELLRRVDEQIREWKASVASNGVARIDISQGSVNAESHDWDEWLLEPKQEHAQDSIEPMPQPLNIRDGDESAEQYFGIELLPKKAGKALPNDTKYSQ